MFATRFCNVGLLEADVASEPRSDGIVLAPSRQGGDPGSVVAGEPRSGGIEAFTIRRRSLHSMPYREKDSR